jgi:hypothetical protein
LTVVVLLTTAGCGAKADSKMPGLVPVTGTITMDGKPLAGAAVSFVGTGTTQTIGAAGITDDTGKYELAVATGDKGAAAGDYKVVVNKLVMADGSPIPPGTTSVAELSTKNLIPPMYSDFTSSQLKATVPPGGGSIDLPLSSDAAPGA